MHTGLLSSESLSKDQVLRLFRESTNARVLSSSSSHDNYLGFLVFLEPSTRTRVSFEAAGLALGMKWVSVGSFGSSLEKGESLKDTFMTLSAYRPKVFVIRSGLYGLSSYVQKWTQVPVINAGEGSWDHPTQGLLDAFCLHQLKRPSLSVAFFGDTRRSRVFRSDAYFFSLLGYKIFLCDDETDDQKRMSEAFGFPLVARNDLKKMDIVMGLRVQKERGSLLSQRPLEPKDLGAKALLMHPGPAVVDSDVSKDLVLWLEAHPERSLISKQVAAGLLLRKLLLKRCLEGAL